MTEQQLVESLHRGIHETNTMHAAWTGGWWVTAYGVENFLVGNVTRYIMEQDNPPTYATLETSFADLYYEGGKLPKGPRTLSNKNNNRLDLALYSSKNLIHVIEFKRFCDPKCLHDIDRLNKLLHILGKQKGGFLRTGIFVLLVECKARSSDSVLVQLDSKFDRCEKKCTEYIEKKCLNCGTKSYYFSRATEYVEPTRINDGQVLSSLCLVLK